MVQNNRIHALLTEQVDILALLLHISHIEDGLSLIFRLTFSRTGIFLYFLDIHGLAIFIRCLFLGLFFCNKEFR